MAEENASPRPSGWATASTTLLSLKSLCGGGVPSSHPSLLVIFFLALQFLSLAAGSYLCWALALPLALLILLPAPSGSVHRLANVDKQLLKISLCDCVACWVLREQCWCCRGAVSDA